MTIAGRRTFTTKTLAIALAAVALLGPLASLAHIVAVQHVACEHGELVEVGPRARGTSRATSLHAGTAITAAPAAASHGHDHCLLAPMRRDRLGQNVPSAQPVLAVGTPCGASLAEANEPPPPIGVIVLAPKNSPPTA